jgi:hypothetical protein
MVYSDRMERHPFLVGLQLDPRISINQSPLLVHRALLAQAGLRIRLRLLRRSQRRRQHPGHWLTLRRHEREYYQAAI